MTTENTRRLEFMTYIGLFCLVIAWTTAFLWFRAADLGTSQLESREIYLNYFPSFFSLSIITLIDFTLCIAAIIMSGICLSLKGLVWKILNIVILVGCGLRLLLTLFWLM